MGGGERGVVPPTRLIFFLLVLDSVCLYVLFYARCSMYLSISSCFLEREEKGGIIPCRARQDEAEYIEWNRERSGRE